MPKKIKVKWKFERGTEAVERNMGVSSEEFTKLLVALKDFFIEYVNANKDQDVTKDLNKMFTVVIENILNSEKYNETEKILLIFEMGKFYNHEEDHLEKERVIRMIVGAQIMGPGIGIVTKETVEAHKKEMGCDGDCKNCKDKEEKHRKAAMERFGKMKEEKKKNDAEKTSGLYG